MSEGSKPPPSIPDDHAQCSAMSLLPNVLCVVDSILRQGRRRGCTLAEIEQLTGSSDGATSDDGVLDGPRRCDGVGGSSPTAGKGLVFAGRRTQLGRAAVAEAVRAALEAGLLERRDAVFHVVDKPMDSVGYRRDAHVQVQGQAGIQDRAKTSSRSPTDDAVLAEVAVVAGDAPQRHRPTNVDIVASSKTPKTKLQGMDFGSDPHSRPVAEVTAREESFPASWAAKHSDILAWIEHGQSCEADQVEDLDLRPEATTYVQLAKESGIPTSSRLARDMAARLEALARQQDASSRRSLENALPPPKNGQLDSDVDGVGHLERDMQKVLLLDNLANKDAAMCSKVFKKAVNDSSCSKVGSQEPKKPLRNVRPFDGSANVGSFEIKLTPTKRIQLALESLSSPYLMEKKRLAAFTVVNAGGFDEDIAAKRRRLEEKEVEDGQFLNRKSASSKARDIVFSFPRRTTSLEKYRRRQPAKRTALEGGDAGGTLTSTVAGSPPRGGVGDGKAEDGSLAATNQTPATKTPPTAEDETTQADMKNTFLKFVQDVIQFAASMIDRTVVDGNGEAVKHKLDDKVTQSVMKWVEENLLAANERAVKTAKKEQLSLSPVATHQYVPGFEFLEELRLSDKERAKFDGEGEAAGDGGVGYRFGSVAPRVGDVSFFCRAVEEDGVGGEGDGHVSENEEQYEFYS